MRIYKIDGVKHVEMVDTWSTEDILTVRPELTHKQAVQVLEAFIDRDKSTDFEVIEYIAEDLFPEKE